MKISNRNIPVTPQCDPANIPTEFPNRLSDNIFCRDPYILLYGDHYYLYRTAGKKGMECLVSKDLLCWSEPVPVFTAPDDFHGVDDFFWAPECHYYKGNFYIFTSVYSKVYEHRVIAAYRATNPLGPFEDITNGRLSPDGWDAIDGTLYVDDKGQPWLIFVHEWTSTPDKVGTMATAKLSEDFTRLISEPVELFRATDPVWSDSDVTDGPYPFVDDNGKIAMIWSNFSPKGYCVGIAESLGKDHLGPWVQKDVPLYQKELCEEYVLDGGHAMLFYSKEGKLMMSMHSPNSDRHGIYEHVTLLELDESNGLAIKKKWN